MSDIPTPQKATTGADIIAAIKWCHSRAEERHKEMMTALAEMKAAKPAASSAPAGGKKYGDPVPTMALLGKIGDKGTKSTEKACMFGISTEHGFVSVMAFGHRKEEAEKALLMPGDEVEIIGEEPKWEEYPVGSGKGGFKTIFHGVKIIKRAPAPEPQDSYQDFSQSENYSATGHAIPGTSAADDAIPFAAAIYP
jgi:hypothetical protein